MKDDRHTKILKQKAYAQYIMDDALRIGGLDEAIKVRNELSMVLSAAIANSTIAEMFREQIDEYYRETSKRIDIDKLIRVIFKGASESVISLLTFMADKRDLYLCKGIYGVYNNMLEEKFNVVIVDVTTAVELNDHLREVIKAKIKNDLGSDIVLDEHIDKNILGGVVLKAKNRIIDCSLLSIFEKTKSELTSVHNFS